MKTILFLSAIVFALGAILFYVFQQNWQAATTWAIIFAVAVTAFEREEIKSLNAILERHGIGLDGDKK